MKRDMDLIKGLLLEIEEKHDGSGKAVKIDSDQFPDKTLEEITEHLFLLNDGGYIDAVSTLNHQNTGFIVKRLTNSGHDFLDSIRDDKIWAQTKEAGAVAGGFTLELLELLAKGFLKSKIEKHTGIEL